MWDAFPLSKGFFLFLWRFLYRGAGLNTDASLKIKGILSNVGCSVILTLILKKHTGLLWKLLRNCLNLQDIEMWECIKHSYKLSSNKYQKSQLSSTMVFNIQKEFFSLVINTTLSDVITCHLHQTMSCTMYPVDKTATTWTTTGGQPYFPQWPQQEDSPDHAKWLYSGTIMNLTILVFQKGPSQ